VFLALFVVLAGSMGKNIEILKEMIVAYFDEAFRVTELRADSAFLLMRGAVVILFKVTAPLLAAGAVLGAFVGYVQVGSLFSMEAVKPSFEKINPMTGFKNKFFSMQTYMELFKSLVKLVVVGLLVYLGIKGSLHDVALLVRQPVEESGRVAGELLKGFAMKAGGVLVMLGAVDAFFQRHQHTKKLKMSKEDVKKEHKESEGDPHIKHQRKHLHQELMQHNMVQNVKKADVVIVNPTHIAVAITYRKGEMGAPQVSAKGERLIAQQIIAIAKENKIPILRDVPLAHALNEIEVGEEVPEELYTAIAEVLNWVYAQEGER
jgi:flagellar biosynthetic protein FlhB